MVAGLKEVSCSQRNGIVLCSWESHFNLTVSLSIQVYKWVPANLMLVSDPVMGSCTHPSFYRNWDNFWLNGPLGLYDT